MWPGKWASGKQAGKMLQRDLKSAGVPYQDASGRYADFHALRHTFITNITSARKIRISSDECVTSVRGG